MSLTRLTSISGEDMSPLPGEFRLLSDRLFARDSRTACFWQENALNQTRMASNFAQAFTKLSLLGHDQSSLLDCSELIVRYIITRLFLSDQWLDE